MGLFLDTGIAIFSTICGALNFIRQNEDTLPTSVLRPRSAYLISPPPSSSKSPQQPQPPPPQPVASGSSSTKNQASLPTPPLSDEHSDGSSNEAGPSNLRRPTAPQLPPPPRRQPSKQPASTRGLTQTDEYPSPSLPTPPPSEPSAPSLSPVNPHLGLHPKLDAFINNKPLNAPVKKLKHRQHIFHAKFKADVKERLRKTREDMERELYLARRRTGICLHFCVSRLRFEGPYRQL